MNIFKLVLWKKIIIGMVGGLIVGSVFGEYGAYLQPIGSLFINAIQMIIIPLVFCSLVTAMTAVPNLKKLGRIGGKTFVLYIVTSIAAVIIGLALAFLLQPGGHAQLLAVAGTSINQNIEHKPIIDTLIQIVPSNPINALASGDILQIIFFAIVLGLALNLVGKEGKPLIRVFQAGASAMYKVTSLVMELAPYGVFALMAALAGSQGLASLLPLFQLVMVIYLGLFLLAVIVYLPIIWFIIGVSPLSFFKKVIDPVIVAFTTSSSSAALPISMSCAERKLGVSKIVSSFVLPLGSTINMNGTALYQGVAAVFIAQVYGVHLSESQVVLIVLTSLLGAIGTAGIPGAGVIMLSLVLNSVGLPLEGIGLIIAIDRIVDMGRSAFNVIGDLITATIVAKSENEINLDIAKASHHPSFEHQSKAQAYTD